jgi:hypothetical protein
MPLARFRRPLHAIQPQPQRSGQLLAAGVLALYGTYATGTPVPKGPKLDAIRAKVARVSAAIDCAKAKAATCAGFAPGSHAQSAGSPSAMRVSRDPLLRCSMVNGPAGADLVCAS